LFYFNYIGVCLLLLQSWQHSILLTLSSKVEEKYYLLQFFTYMTDHYISVFISILESYELYLQRPCQVKFQVISIMKIIRYLFFLKSVFIQIYYYTYDCIAVAVL
jgi:hypothetical protein